jgi:hypothetical protein
MRQTMEGKTMTINEKQQLLNNILKILPVYWYNEARIESVDLLSDPHALRLNIDGSHYRIHAMGFVETVKGGIYVSDELANALTNALRRGMVANNTDSLLCTLTTF